MLRFIKRKEERKMFKTIKRIFDVIDGKVNKKINTIVEDDPKVVYERVLKVESEKYIEIRNLLKEIKGIHFDFNQQINKLENSKRMYNEDLKNAIGVNNSEVGELCLRKIDEIESNIDDINKNIDALIPEENRILESLENQKKYIDELKTEYMINSSKIKTNSLLERIKDRRYGINTTSLDINLDVIRNSAIKAEANIKFEDENKSNEEKIKEFRKGNSTYKQRFTEMVKK